MQVTLGNFELKVGMKDGSTKSYPIKASDIPTLFHQIPGATDILSDVFQSGLNRYQLYRKMVKRDTTLNTAVNKMAMLVARSYQGFIVHPGDTEEQSEKDFLKEVNDMGEKMKLGNVFYAAARGMLIDGDVLINPKKINGVPRMDFLPMSNMSAIRQYGDVNITWSKDMDMLYPGPANYYVYNENQVAQKIYSKQNILHIALNNMAEHVEDIIGRNTWGIWSHSALESLRPEVYWRLSSMVNDMTWRMLYLPREHHELDVTDMMDPSLYDGDTEDERRANMMTAVGSALTAYVTGLKNQMPDQGYVTPKVGDISSVVITMIEPKSTTYTTPNELIDQLAMNINSAYNVKGTAQGRSSFAAENIVSSDSQVAAMFIGMIIREGLLEYMKKLYKDSEHVEKLDIRLQLILPKDIEALVRQAAVLRAAEVTTINEIRVKYLGLDPLTKEQRAEMKEENAMSSDGSNKNAKSREGIKGDVMKVKNPDEQEDMDGEETDESKFQRQKT